MKKPIIAAQLYTLRDFTKEPAQLAKTFAKVKKIGYDYAQVSAVGALDSGAISAKDLRNVMVDAGVEPIGSHVGLAAWRNNFKDVITQCHDLGIKYAAIPWLSWQEYKDYTAAQWKKLFREFDTIAKKAAKEGIAVQYHNHDFEFNQFFIKGGKDGKTLLEMMFDTCTTLQGEPDFGWVMRGGMDPVLWARRMKGRMDQVHFKDWGLINGQFVFRAIGQGRINWPAVVAECKKGGTHTYIVEQDTCVATNDPFKSLSISREYLKTILG